MNTLDTCAAQFGVILALSARVLPFGWYVEPTFTHGVDELTQPLVPVC